MYYDSDIALNETGKRVTSDKTIADALEGASEFVKRTVDLKVGDVLIITIRVTE